MRKHHHHMNKRHGGADAGRTGEGSDARSAGERKSEMIIYTENILLPEVVRTSCECEWPATAASRGKQVGTQLKSQGWASTTFFLHRGHKRHVFQASPRRIVHLDVFLVRLST